VTRCTEMSRIDKARGFKAYFKSRMNKAILDATIDKDIMSEMDKDRVLERAEAAKNMRKYGLRLLMYGTIAAIAWYIFFKTA